MGKVTDITRQKGNRNRVSVFIDGAFYCGLEEFTALKYRVRIGDEVDEAQLGEWQAESEYTTALDKSLSYLSIRPRSGKEIETYLKGKGYLPSVTERVKDRLTELGYLNDEAYARQYVDENKCRYGMYRLKNELLKRGVDRETVDEAIEQTDCSEETVALARSLYKGCGGDKYKLKNKLYRKGCSPDDISAAMSGLSDEGFFDGDASQDEDIETE